MIIDFTFQITSTFILLTPDTKNEYVICSFLLTKIFRKYLFEFLLHATRVFHKERSFLEIFSYLHPYTCSRRTRVSISVYFMPGWQRRKHLLSQTKIFLHAQNSCGKSHFDDYWLRWWFFYEYVLSLQGKLYIFFVIVPAFHLPTTTTKIIIYNNGVYVNIQEWTLKTW